MTDQDIETEIKAAGADVAPRVTLAEIEAAIASEHYFTAADAVFLGQPPNVSGPMGEPGRPACALDRLTFCVLVLRNGYTIVGTSACVSSENFNAEIGRKIAREDAINQTLPLFGFALAENIYRTNQTEI